MADAIAGKTNMITQPQPHTTRPNITPNTEKAALPPDVSCAPAKAWIRQKIEKKNAKMGPMQGMASKIDVEPFTKQTERKVAS